LALSAFVFNTLSLTIEALRVGEGKFKNANITCILLVLERKRERRENVEGC
jgi:hypothetical protein